MTYRGQDANTYYSTAGYASPSWTLLSRVVGDTINLSGSDVGGANR